MIRRRETRTERLLTPTHRVILMGDVMLGRGVDRSLETRPPAGVWGDLLPELLEADLRIANLECVLTDLALPELLPPKAFHFRSAARNVAVLEAGQVSAVSLANNHALDYGPAALVDMLGTLSAHGIQAAGAGRDLAEAERLARMVKDGWSLGLLAFTDNEPQWEAGVAKPGLCYVPTDLHDPRARALLERVERAREEVDFVVVSAHWGGNWGYRPEAGHRAFARALIDHGADLIYGHSAHVFRGIEFYRERPILYGTGDLVDDYAVDLAERNDESFLYEAVVEEQLVRELLLHPTAIEDMRANPAPMPHDRAIVRKMASLCADLGTPTEWLETEARLRVPRVAGAVR